MAEKRDWPKGWPKPREGQAAPVIGPPKKGEPPPAVGTTRFMYGTQYTWTGEGYVPSGLYHPPKAEREAVTLSPVATPGAGVSVETGEEVTGILPNVGWVQTEKGPAYDPLAYTRMKGKESAAGFLGFIGISEAQSLPRDYAQLSPEAQFEAQKRAGLIPLSAQFIPTDTGWTYIPTTKFTAGKESEIPEIAQLKADKELWDILTLKGSKAFAEELESRKAEKQAEFEEELEKASPELYKIYEEQGYEAYLKEAERISKGYEEFQQKITSGEIIALPDGQYITKEDFDKLTEGQQEILMAEGFSGYFAAKEFYASVRAQIDVKREEAIAQWLEDNPYPGFIKSGGYTEGEWSSIDSNFDLLRVANKAVGEEQDRLLAGMTPEEREMYEKGVVERAKEIGVGGLGLIAPPAKALLPEYTIKDISAAEWALGGINAALIATCFAPGVIMGSMAGRGIVTGLSTTGAGVVGYHTARDWSNMTTGQRAMGAGGTLLYALPLLATVPRGVKITAVKIPTIEGEAVAWRGLALLERPAVGVSGGKLVFGARNITLPEARMILAGYEPVTVIETKVFVNPKALETSGFTKVEIDKLIATLKDRNLFMGEKSPYLSREALIEPTEYLSADEINVLLRQVVKVGNKVKQVEVYGSPTIKAQLAPELRGWRGIHDWDIQTNMRQADTEMFVKSVLDDLNQLPGVRQYRINPESPFLIEKRIQGQWKHIADIHSQDMVYPASEMVAEGSYGRIFAEPAIKVKYPGIGEIEIMRLSESGVRKASSILQVRGGNFRPAPHRVKDIADFYVILRTFKGERIANEWARVFGYSSDDLMRVAMETPTDLLGWRFKPASTVTVSPGASPSISVMIPASMVASVPASLQVQISSPVSPYSVSPSVSASIMASASRLIPSPPSGMPSAEPSYKITPSPYSIIRSISGYPSPYPSVSPYPSPSASLYPSPSPSASIPSGPPSYPPSYLSVAPSPPSPLPATPSRGIPLPKAKAPSESAEIPRGTITFRMGRKWVVIPPPYEQEVVYYQDEPPAGIYKYAEGKGSAYETVQVLAMPHGQRFLDEDVDIDIGWAKVYIEAGREPTIEFTGGKRAAEKRWAEEKGITQGETVEGTEQYGLGDIILPEERVLLSEERLVPNQASYYRSQGLNTAEITELEKRGLLDVSREEAEAIAREIKKGKVPAEEMAGGEKLLTPEETVEGTTQYGKGDIISEGERLVPGATPYTGGDKSRQVYDIKYDVTEEEKRRRREKREEEEYEENLGILSRETSLGPEIEFGEVNLGGEIGAGREIEKSEPITGKVEPEEMPENRSVIEGKTEEISAEKTPSQTEMRDDLREAVREPVVPLRNSQPTLSQAAVEIEEGEESERPRRNERQKTRRRVLMKDNSGLPGRYYLGRRLPPTEIMTNI